MENAYIMNVWSLAGRPQGVLIVLHGQYRRAYQSCVNEDGHWLRLNRPLMADSSLTVLAEVVDGYHLD